jgi:hypothetical protein
LRRRHPPARPQSAMRRGGDGGLPAPSENHQDGARTRAADDVSGRHPCKISKSPSTFGNPIRLSCFPP